MKHACYNQSRNPRRFCFFVKISLFVAVSIVIALVCSTVSGATTNKIDTNPSQPPAELKRDTVVNKDLSQLTQKIIELSTNLLDMQVDLDKIKSPKQLSQKIAPLFQGIKNLETQFHESESTFQERQLQLTNLQFQLQIKERKVKKLLKKVDKAVFIFDHWIDFWSDQRKILPVWQKGLGPSSKLPLVQKKINKLKTIIDTAEMLINDNINPLLEMQDNTAEILISIHSLDIQINKLLSNIPSVEQWSNGLFSPLFWTQFNGQLAIEILWGASKVLKPDTGTLVRNKLPFSLALICCIVLSLLLFNRRHYLLKSSPHLKFLGQCPVSTSLLVGLSLFLPLLPEMSPCWITVYRGVLLASLMRVSSVLISDNLINKLMTGIIVLLFFNYLLVTITLPMALLRIYVTVASCLLIIVFVIFIKHLKRSLLQKQRYFLWCAQIAIVVQAVVIISEASGRPNFSFFVFGAFVKTVFSSHIIWILYLSATNILEAALLLSPFPYLAKNARHILESFRFLLTSAAFLSFSISFVVIWRIFPAYHDALSKLSSYGFSWQGSRISVGIVLSACLVIYAAYIISRIVKVIMRQSVFSRQEIPKGVEHSITRLIHYGIISVGFLFALSTLGFDTTKVTILGGAVGVGIGFGLKEILSNLVSGLILLFEQPIKVGDTIVIGDEWGEVKKLGLRSTIIETFDNAEIVVPNSTFVTNQVTNWTLKKREVRLKVPVGVAYGSDVDKVIQILKECASNHPEVLSSPEPSVVFLSFGASSLDFLLRCYVPDVDIRLRVLGELNQAINLEFATAGIEIPFPQKDLHLKSISPNLQSLFRKR